MIAELVAIAQMLVAGIPLARILDRHAETREIGARVGEGFLLGAGVCAAMVVALPWSRGVLIAVLVIAGVSAAVFANRQRAAGGPAGEPPALRGRSFALLLILFALVAIFGYALYATLAPPPEFDYLADWGLKARAFFEVRSIDWQLLGRAIARDTHPDYPLLLPLTYDFIAILRNGSHGIAINSANAE